MILILGLMSRNLTVIIIGLMLITLSRYTLIFWMPMFAILLWLKDGWGQSIKVWGSLALAVIVFYIIPFILQDPTIFFKGIKYHNKAVTGEWLGYGTDRISWTMEKGVYFAKHFKACLSGDMAERSHQARYIQGGMMLVVMAIGLFIYYKIKNRIHYYDFSLAFVFVFIMIFYLFSPLTYVYYYLLPLMIAGVMTADVVTQ